MGLSPRNFWTLSLVEWRWLCGEAASEGMTRAELSALAEIYPDKREGRQ